MPFPATATPCGPDGKEPHPFPFDLLDDPEDRIRIPVAVVVVRAAIFERVVDDDTDAGHQIRELHQSSSFTKLTTKLAPGRILWWSSAIPMR